MSSHDSKERRTRRSSILKKANTEEANADVTEYTNTEFSSQLGNQKKFSKRVSFSNTDQVKEIAPLWDIKRNWQDSASSEEGGSTLADISNLITPNIKKSTLLDHKNKGSKALQNLLKGTIIDQNSSNLNPLSNNGGPCVMDVSKTVSVVPEFSFFDNSRLEFGPQAGDEDGNGASVENDADVSQNFYTKNFLSTLNFVGSKNVIDDPKKIVCPAVKPPSYNQCVKMAGQNHPALDPRHADESSDWQCEEVDLTCRMDQQSAIDASHNLPIFSQEFNQQELNHTLEHEMDFTECAISGTKKHRLLPAQETLFQAAASEVIAGHRESFTEHQMDLTACVSQGEKKIWPCSEQNKLPQSSAAWTDEHADAQTENQMDFTECVSAAKISPSMSEPVGIGGIEFTDCVTSTAKITVPGLPVLADEMDFTNVTVHARPEVENVIDNIAGHRLKEMPGKLENMDVTEVNPVSHSSEVTHLNNPCRNSRTIHLNGSVEGNMDFTCTNINSAVSEGQKYSLLDKDDENNGIRVQSSIDHENIGRNSPGKENDQTDVVTDADTSMEMTCFTATNLSRKVANIEVQIELDDLLKPNNDKEGPVQSLEPSVAFDSSSLSALKNMAGFDGRPSEFAAEKVSENAHVSDTEDIIVSSPLPRRVSKARNSIGIYKANMARIKLPKYEEPGTHEKKDDNFISDTNADLLSPPKEKNDALMDDVFEIEISAPCLVVPQSTCTNTYHLELAGESVHASEIMAESVLKDTGENDVKCLQVEETARGSLIENLRKEVANLSEEKDLESGVSRSKEILDVISKVESPVQQEKLCLAVEVGQPEKIEHLKCLDKVQMGPQPQEMFEYLSLEEFLHDYAGIHLTRRRLSINVTTDRPKTPSGLKEMFKVKYWIPRELLIRESFEESIKTKMSDLEQVISQLEENLSASNPKIIETVTHDQDETSSLRVKELAGRCKSLGNLYWKRDLTKLFKGLNGAMELYIKEDLQPITNQLNPPHKMLDLALTEVEDESRRLDIEIQQYENHAATPTAEQAVEYQKIDKELTKLNKKYGWLLERMSACQKQKQDLQWKRRKLLDKILGNSEEVDIRMLKNSLVSLERQSKWKMVTIKDNLLEFSFLRGTVSFKVLFADKLPLFEWSKKIYSFSIETITDVKPYLESDLELYKVVHEMWRYLLVPNQLLSKYPDLCSLKALLKLMSDLAQKSEDLIEDKDWINSRIVSELRFKRDDCTFAVEFQPPRIRTDGFVVKFLLNSKMLECYEDPLQEVLKNGFLPVFHECMNGKRQWDRLRSDDVGRIIHSVAPGDHYIKRAICAILDYIDYKF